MKTEITFNAFREYLEGCIRGCDKNIAEIGDPSKRFKFLKSSLEDVLNVYNKLFAEVPSEPVSHSR